MTQLLHICSRAALRATFLPIAAMLYAASGQAAAVEGTIDITPAVQHSHAQQMDFSDVVVWMDSAKDAPVRPIDSARVRLLQKNKMFTPHVLAIRVGTVVDFPNADPIFHNAFSNYNGQLFDLSLYRPGSTKSVRFRRPGIVRVFCNIHPTMSAVIVVLDTPYFTKVKPDGHYRISSVPPGSYTLHVFDERATGTAPETPDVRVLDSDIELQSPTLRISEDGYVPLPHKNKYGLEYPPASSADGYGGTAK